MPQRLETHSSQAVVNIAKQSKGWRYLDQKLKVTTLLRKRGGASFFKFRHVGRQRVTELEEGYVHTGKSPDCGG